MGQLLMFDKGEKCIEGLTPKGNPFEYMVSVFVPAIRTILSDGGFTKIQNSREEGGEFIVAWKRNLFCIEGDFQVCEPVDNYYACGCGDPYAKGSLYTSSGVSKKRVITALKCAERHSAGVRGPFKVLET